MDNGFIIIKQTEPQIGQIVVFHSEVKALISMLSACESEAIDLLSNPQKPNNG